MAAYDPNDPTQQGFLSALASGESGGYSDPYHIGVGGTDLSHASTYANGFPIWGGSGDSHAAGAYQFQPGTWAPLASRYNLNFQSPADQNAGAWYLAQDTYLSKTGRNLEQDLQAGNYSYVNDALHSTWTSTTTGQGGGLAQRLAAGIGAEIAPGSSSDNLAASGGSTGGGVLGTVAQYFVRGGMILIGVIVIGVALYALLVHYDYAPSPSQLVKA